MRRIYTRVVLDMTKDDLPILESESYLYGGPMALCVDGRGDPNQNDGRGDSESGNGSGYGGADGRAEGRTAGNASGFGAAIDQALNEMAMDTFGKMGLAGAYASADMARAGGVGFGGYAGAPGTDYDYGLPDVWSRPLNALFDTPQYTALDSLALSKAAFNSMMGSLVAAKPADRMDAVVGLDQIAWNGPNSYSPEALAGSLARDVDAGLANLGLDAMDTMNNTFATDVHDQQFGQQVADLNAAASATSYDSMVNAVYSSATSALQGRDPVTADHMRDLAEISLPEIFGTAMKMTNPVSAVGGMVDIVGMLTNNITARDIIGSLTTGLGLSKSLGSALSVANLMSAGAVPGLDFASGLLGAGFGMAGYAAVKEYDRNIAPGDLASMDKALSDLGIDVGELGNDNITGELSKAAPSASSSSSESGGGGSNKVQSVPMSNTERHRSKSPKVISFAPVEGTVIPFNEIDVNLEDPWYGNNKVG